ncbi:hypothetical protein L7F22_062067 [Adiantum nelumboides]|nr:hypothetical protein [Adiantum nelumboides]
MKGARAVAAVATVGNLLNGWDSAMLAGALLYIEPEYDLDDLPVLEGMVAAASLVGAAISSTFAGSGADRLGRRSIVCVSAVIFCIGALLMVWSPNVYMLLVARLIDGVGVGLAVTVAPMYISEVAPPEIRGKLNTLPQLAGTGGMFLAYCVGFGISLSSNPSWRIMLGLLLFPSLVYLALGIFYLPESPRWLVSKGKMKEARQVLQLLRNSKDVSGELAMLVEGLGVGEEAFLEEYFIEPAESEGKDDAAVSQEPHIKIFAPEDGTSWIARSTSGIPGSQQLLSRPGSVLLSRPGSLLRQSTPNRQSFPLMDPVISLMGRVSGNFAESLSRFGSMSSNIQGQPFDTFDNEGNEESDVGRLKEISVGGEVGEESPLLSRQTTGQLEEEDVLGVDATTSKYAPRERQSLLREGSITSPLLSRQTTEQLEEEDVYRTDPMIARATSTDKVTPREKKSPLFPQSSLPLGGSLSGSVGSTGVGAGWKLVWQWTGPQGTEGKAGEGEFRRVYLHQESRDVDSHVSSTHSLPCFGSSASNLEPIQAAALVSGRSRRASLENQVGPALIHPAESARKGLAWSELLEGGVKQALIVGILLQALEQFGGINGVLNYTPTILEESGAEVLLSGFGITSDSASLLSSAAVELICLPCILIAMQLMDKLGRRAILLRTLPILIIALLALIIINIVPANAAVFSAISIGGVVVFLSVFVMGFGPIPNMLCAEIFPTRVRGVCIGICQAAMWLSNIVVTELFPLLDDSIGIAGSFAFFAVFLAISWVFIFLKVPETKGMPLEVIVEFFAMSAAGSKPTAAMDVRKDAEEQV